MLPAHRFYSNHLMVKRPLEGPNSQVRAPLCLLSFLVPAHLLRSFREEMAPSLMNYHAEGG